MSQTMMVDTAADLQAALTTASRGDTLLLGAGHYGALSLGHDTSAHCALASEITIRSLDSAAPAVFSGLNVKSVTQLTLDGLVFDYGDGSDTQGAEFPFSLSHSTDITLRNTVFKGDLDPTAPSLTAQFGVGLAVHKCTGIHLLHNTISHFNRGLLLSGSQNLTVSQNRVHTIGAAGIECVNLRNARIQSNHLFDFWHSLSAIDPPVMIRFFADTRQKSSQDITLQDNWLEIGRGTPARSILVTSKEAPGTSIPLVACQDLTIIGNMILNRDFHGIQTDCVATLRLERNLVLYSSAKGAPPRDAGDIPRIMIDPTSSNVTARQNVTSALDGFDHQITWDVQDTGVIRYDTPHQARLYTRALVKAALTPLEGSTRFAVKRASLPMPLRAPADAPVSPPPLPPQPTHAAPPEPVVSSSAPLPAVTSGATLNVTYGGHTKQRTRMPRTARAPKRSSSWVAHRKTAATRRVRLGQTGCNPTLPWAEISQLVHSHSYRVDMTAKMLATPQVSDLIQLPGSFVIRMDDKGDLQADLHCQHNQTIHMLAQGLSLSDHKEHCISLQVTPDFITLEIDGVIAAQQVLPGPLHVTDKDDMLFPYEGMLGFVRIAHQPAPAEHPMTPQDHNGHILGSSDADMGLGDRFEFLA